MILCFIIGSICVYLVFQTSLDKMSPYLYLNCIKLFVCFCIQFHYNHYILLFCIALYVNYYLFYYFIHPIPETSLMFIYATYKRVFFYSRTHFSSFLNKFEWLFTFVLVWNVSNDTVSEVIQKIFGPLSFKLFYITDTNNSYSKIK